MAYTPPDNKNIFFNFTSGGYEAPTDELLFNFREPGTLANLTAAIQVTQLYRDEAYTYEKYCPKYVIGYFGGGIQVIKGPCVFGGIRDLGATIEALDYTSTSSDLPAVLNAVKYAGTKDLTANVTSAEPSNLQGIIGAHLPGDLPALINSIIYSGTKDLTAQIDLHLPSNLQAVIDIHNPKNLGATVKPWNSGTYDLGGIFIGEKYKGQGNLQSEIDLHSPANLGAYIDFLPAPENLYASIKAWYKSQKDLLSSIRGFGANNLHSFIGTHIPADLTAEIVGQERPAGNLPANLYGWQTSNLGTVFTGFHIPVNLLAYLNVKQSKDALFPASIHAWHASDLNTYVNLVFPKDLKAQINLIQPADLSAYLKVRLVSSLTATVYSWQTHDLGGSIKRIYDSFLSAKINSRTDILKNLSARIKGYGSLYQNLNGYLKTFHEYFLGGQINPILISNLFAYLYPVQPVNLNANLHGWAERYLQGIIDGLDYPWNLTAEIYPKGRWSILNAIIFPRKDREIYNDLNTFIHPWEIRYLTSSIVGANAVFLSAFLNPLGAAKDLHAYIRPKMIRLTTVINIPTYEHKDLSAIINYLCFATGYSNLTASIYTKFKSDLLAYINAVIYDYKPANLGAKIGYTDSYLEVDKLKLSITILPGSYFTEDKYRLVLNILDAESLLNAYIRGTLRYTNISANIVGQSITSYVFDSSLKNRERVIHKNYAGIFETFEIVEMAFKSAVKEYYYSSAGDYAWKQNSDERWVLDVRSVLPADTALRLKRRLHRATTMYDLKKFNTIDEALRFAISYVTEYPQSNLGASIYNKGTYKILGGMINPKYKQSTRSNLNSSITPAGSTIIVSTENNISKI